jgi:hypothetical protein
MNARGTSFGIEGSLAMPATMRPLAGQASRIRLHERLSSDTTLSEVSLS